MFRKWIRRVKSHPKKTVSIVMLAAFVALNGVAYMHARAMTHFTSSGEGTARPDELSTVEKAKVLLTGVRILRPVNDDLPSSYDLPYSTHRFSGPNNIEYEGWYIPQQNSQGLCILYHGYAGCKSSLLAEAQVLAEMKYESFLIDFRGCGGSSGDVTTIGFLEAEDVEASVRFVRENLTRKPLILYGQSMGSVAVLRAVSQRDLGAQALILECPFDRLLSTAKNRFAVMGIPSFPFAQLLVFWGGYQHGFSGFHHNPVDYAAKVECPVLLMNGELDDRVTNDQITSVFDHVQGRKQLVLFPETGHESCLLGNADLWKRTIENFLNRL